MPGLPGAKIRKVMGEIWLRLLAAFWGRVDEPQISQPANLSATETAKPGSAILPRGALVRGYQVCSRHPAGSAGRLAGHCHVKSGKSKLICSGLLFMAQVCLHSENLMSETMRSVTVRIRAAELSATMSAIGEWLDANRYEPTKYRYDHDEDDVLVTVDFPAEVAAEAFTVRFDGIYRLSPQPASLESPRQLSPLAFRDRR